MTEQSMQDAPGTQRETGAGDRQPERQHAARTQMEVALERACQAGAKAAVAIVEINPEYAGRAPQRMDHVLAYWRLRHHGRLDAIEQGTGRVVLVVAPVVHAAHGRALTERFARALDPRICPLLNRALPYASYGVSLYPDDGLDAGTLIARAEQALREARAAGTRSRTFAAAPRRHAAARVLGPVAVRGAPIQP